MTGYELTAAPENARRVVKCFFELDAEYLSNRPKDGMVFNPSDKEAGSYYRLICGGGSSDCDDRCSAIEVQLSRDIDLRQHILMAVILPLHFLEDLALRQTIVTVWGAVPLTYYTVIGTRPQEYHMVIGQMVRRLYEHRGLL